MAARLLGALLLALLLLARPAAAQERILAFDADITVQADGSFLVTETIRVRAEGDRIRFGIFRDVPILQQDGWRTRRVGFELRSATRDGAPEAVRQVEGDRALRLYLGREGRRVATGEHVYALTYVTDRQLRRFDTQDEVYWNATGTEWLFPIDRATATVRLPPGAEIRDLAAFTGAFGATGGDARFRRLDGHVARFETTRPLAAREGLTIAVAFAKGAIAAPSDRQRRDWFWRDHGPTLRGAGIAAALAAFLAGLWLLWGRDPKPGVIVPRWEPPAGLSAALVRLAWNRHTDLDGLMSLVLVEMAARGLIELDPSGAAPRLSAGATRPGPDLPAEQRLVLDAIQAAGGTLTIERAQGQAVRRLEQGVATALRQQHRALGLRRRAWPQVLAGLAATVAAVLGIALPLPEPLKLSLLILAPLLMLALLPLLGGRGGVLMKLFWLVMLSPFLALLGHAVLRSGDPGLLGVMLAVALLARIALPRLGGPTPRGRQLLDEIEGLAGYIRVAEAERLRIAGAPDMSQPHFERILPYAMALDLEAVWVRHFQDWLARAQPEAATQPREWRGRRLAGFYGTPRAGGRPPSLQSQLASSLTSALPAASATGSGFSRGGSGSRGGASGRGGGGGGGGGW